MDLRLSQAVIKTGRRDPPLWMIFMALVMILVIGVFIALPPFLKSYEFQEYGPTIIVNVSTGTTDDDLFHKTGHILGEGPSDEVGELPSSDHHLLVQTQNGWIQGVESGGVRVFHGLPYAQPPIGHLRWSAPREIEPWSPDVYNATFKRNGCPQRCKWHQYCPQNTSEDCLYMEIYTPLNALPTSKVPVVVYLHGGDFNQMSATSPVYDSSYLVNRTGVMVVLVEYRLGALGYLVHTDDTNDIIGNFGLLDQAMALEWIQRNAEAFGGDPNKVTLAGQSAGSQSALIHLQSSETSRKFRSVILESAPLSLPLKNFSEALEQSHHFAYLTGCAEAKSKREADLDLDCLRNLDTDAILDAQDQIKSFGSGYLSKAQPWGPVIDKKTLSKQLLDSFDEYEERYRKPILWGVTGEEALIYIKSWFKRPTGFIVYTLALSILGKGVDRHRLKSVYPSNSDDSREDVSAMATDFLFRCPLQWAAKKLHSKGIDTMWNYVWHKTLIFSKSNFGYVCSDRSCHSIEIPYVFHNFDALNTTSEDIRVSDTIIDYYGNFIKYGNPNERKGMKGPDVPLPEWSKAFISGQYQALGFNKDGTVGQESGVIEERCRLWIDKNFTLKR